MSESRAVLVTGGVGYIGGHTVRALRERGRRVVVVDDLSTGVRAAAPSGVGFYEGKVEDSRLIAKVLRDEQVGAVVHLAGSISAAESMLDPARYYRNNTAASWSLALACIAAGVEAFLFSSSAAVYGVADLSPISEEAATAPINPYGASKLMAEVMLANLAIARPGFRPLCLRYFNVAGSDPAGGLGRGHAEGLIRICVEAAVGDGREVPIFGDDYDTRDGTGERDYVHVSDIALAHALGVDYLEAGGAPTTLNCGYGRGHTVLEVIAAVERLAGHPIGRRLAPRRPADPASAVADVSRLRATLDWRPRFDTLDAILGSAFTAP